MATSAAATSAVSRESSASDQSNRLGGCSGGGGGGASSAASTSARARATPWVREAGLGLPVTTAIRMAVTSVSRIGRRSKCYHSPFGISRLSRGGGGLTRAIGRRPGGRGEGDRVRGAVQAGRRGVGPQAAGLQDRQHALAEPVRLL